MPDYTGKAAAGVYVAQGPAGVYVGEAVDCFSRNRQLTIMGVSWGIVREMPGSTLSERRKAECEVADYWASRGWIVVSRNTSSAKRIAVDALRAACTTEEQSRGGTAGGASDKRTLETRQRAGHLGGTARKRNISSERASEIGRQGAHAVWKKMTSSEREEKIKKMRAGRRNARH